MRAKSSDVRHIVLFSFSASATRIFEKMTSAQEDKVADAHKVFYEEGFQIRSAVAGPEHVERSLQNNASDFARPMQDLATEVGWGMVWTRPGL